MPPPIDEDSTYIFSSLFFLSLLRSFWYLEQKSGGGGEILAKKCRSNYGVERVFCSPQPFPPPRHPADEFRNRAHAPTTRSTVARKSGSGSRFRPAPVAV